MRKIQIPGVGIYKDSNGVAEFWRVRLGKKFTGGEIIKKTFGTYQAAKEWVEGQNAPKEKHGASYYDMSPAQIAEARNAFERLAKLDSTPIPTLTEALNYYVKHAMPSGGTRTFEELSDEFMVSRKAMNCKPKTLVQYESYFNILKECQGSNQNQPAKIESKPASLRRGIHIGLLAFIQVVSWQINRAGSASSSLSSRFLRSRVQVPWFGDWWWAPGL